MKDFNYSYWETKQYFQPFDLIVVGAGIVGLCTAISFKELYPKARILILERGIIPNGASTKNAGFACFGSPGELLEDLKTMPEDIVWDTVRMRWKGLQRLRKHLSDRNMDYRHYGGFELFQSQSSYVQAKEQINFLNGKIKRAIGLKNCYKVQNPGDFSFNKISGAILNSYEGQIDTGLMMTNLTLKARKAGITILNGVNVLHITELNNRVELESNAGTFKAHRLVIATNGFARAFFNIKGLKPARAQVLITKPVKNLEIKGAFHFHKGYYYFRNIDNRILFGGGRHLDFKGETTAEQGINNTIQNTLNLFLREIILPNVPFEIEQRWSGIMGVGKEKKPIIKPVGKNTVAAVRMGGMGIAIGSLVGEKAAKLIL